MECRKRFAARSLAGAALFVLTLCQAGCYSTQSGWLPPSVSRVFAPRALDPEPIDRSHGRLRDGLEQDRRGGGQILRYRVREPAGANDSHPAPDGRDAARAVVLDSVTFHDRLEASMQTIRRFAIVKIEPVPTGGYLVKVEVRKELEDLAKPDRQAAGRAVFYNEFPVNRAREIVGPVPVPLGWIPRGRDPNLEQAILAGIRDAFFL